MTHTGGDLDNGMIERLLGAAFEARKRAYARYSGFPVGAAVLTGSGAVYSGCNVENASYGLTVCAERVAIFKAVSEGGRDIRAVCVVAGDSGLPRPCGACLQVMSEFRPAEGDVIIILANTSLEWEARRLSDLLLMPFELA